MLGRGQTAESAGASLEEDKRLTRFFAADKSPRKRLRTALEFVRGSTPEQEARFFSQFYSTIYTVISGTVVQYDKLKQNDGRSGEGVMNKLRRKHITNDDWEDLFELFSRLMVQCNELIAKGWQRNGITETLQKFTHPGNQHQIRVEALTLLLQFCTTMQQTDAPHTELVACSVDYPIIQSEDPLLSSRSDLSWSLPNFWQDEPIDCLKADSMSHAPQALEILDVVLNFTLRPPAVTGEVVTPEKRLAHFAFWAEILFRYFFPVFFPAAANAAAHLKGSTTPHASNASAEAKDESVTEQPSMWAQARIPGFEVCPILIQLSLEKWFQEVLANPALSNELWRDEYRASILEEMCRQRFIYTTPEGQQLMARTILLYHHILAGEDIAQPMYITAHYAHYCRLFVSHTNQVYTAKPTTFSLNMQIDLIGATQSLYPMLTRQELPLESFHTLRDQLLDILDQSYAKFTADALSRTVQTALQCLFQCVLSSPDRLDKDILKYLTTRITPYLIPLDYDKNSLSKHFIDVWGGHVVNLFHMVLRFMERTPREEEHAAVSDLLGSDYSAASRWTVTNTDWLKIGSVQEALLVWDRLIHLIPPHVCEQLDPVLYANVIRVFNNVTNIAIHDAIVPSKHYTRLEPLAPDKEARQLQKKAAKQRSKEEDVEKVSPLIGMSPSTILSLIGPWVLPACSQSRMGYENSMALGFEALCSLLCAKSATYLPKHMESQVLGYIFNGLRTGPLLVLASIVTYSRKLFALDIPGTTLLASIYLSACRKILAEDVFGDARKAAKINLAVFADPSLELTPADCLRSYALELLRGMSSYANRYPNIKTISSHDDASMDWEADKKLYTIKQDIEAILEEFMSMANPSSKLKRDVISMMALSIVDDLHAGAGTLQDRLLTSSRLRRLVEYCNDAKVEVAITSMDAIKDLAIYQAVFAEQFHDEVEQFMLGLATVCWQQLVIICQYAMSPARQPVSPMPTASPLAKDRSSTNSLSMLPPTVEQLPAEVEGACERVTHALDCMGRWIVRFPALLDIPNVAQKFFEVLEASLIGKFPAAAVDTTATAAATPRMLRDLISMHKRSQKGLSMEAFARPAEKAQDILFHLLNHYRYYPLVEGCEVIDSSDATEYLGLTTGEDKHCEISNEDIEGQCLVHLVYHDDVLISLVGRPDGKAAVVIRDYLGTHTYKASELNPTTTEIDPELLSSSLQRRIDVTHREFRSSLVDEVPPLDDIQVKFVEEAERALTHSSDSAVSPVSNQPFSKQSNAGSSEYLDQLGAAAQRTLSVDSVTMSKVEDYEERVQQIQAAPNARGQGSVEHANPLTQSIHGMFVAGVEGSGEHTTHNLNADPLKQLLQHLPSDMFDDPTLLGGNAYIKTLDAQKVSAADEESGNRIPEILSRIMKDPEAARELTAFLEAEFAGESLRFYLSVIEFKNTDWSSPNHSEAAMQEAARAIVEQHVRPSAPEQINVADQMSRDILDAVHSNAATPTLFDGAVVEVAKMLVRDKISRFMSGSTLRRLEIFSQCEDLEDAAGMLEVLETNHAKLFSPPSGVCEPQPMANPVTPSDAARRLIAQFGLVPHKELQNFKILHGTDDLKWKGILRNLKHLDSMPVREQIKTAVVYVGPGQANQNEILANTAGSAEYDEFVKSLGWEVDLQTHRGFAGKVDTKRVTNGSRMPYYADDEVEVFFHVATMMPNEEDEQQVSKKRHIGNDIVHIVWSEHDREYLPFTVTSDFGDVIIVIYPLKRSHKGLFRIQVLSKTGLGFVGPLVDGAVVPQCVLGPLVRSTVVSANRVVREHQAAVSGVYEKPYPTRRRVISEIVHSYAQPFNHNMFLTLLYRGHITMPLLVAPAPTPVTQTDETPTERPRRLSATRSMRLAPLRLSGMEDKGEH